MKNDSTAAESAPNADETAASPASSTTEKPKTSVMREVDKKVTAMVDETSKLSKIPKWGVVTIFIGIIIVILGVVFFCVRRFFRKRRGKDGKKGMKGVDLKSVQLLGSAYKEKVT